MCFLAIVNIGKKYYIKVTYSKFYIFTAVFAFILIVWHKLRLIYSTDNLYCIQPENLPLIIQSWLRNVNKTWNTAASVNFSLKVKFKLKQTNVNNEMCPSIKNVLGFEIFCNVFTFNYESSNRCR